RSDHLFLSADDATCQSGTAAATGRGRGRAERPADRRTRELMRTDGFNTEQRWQPSRATISSLLLGLIVLLVVAFLTGYVPLHRREATLRAEVDAQEKGLPRLVVMRVSRGPDQNEINLPGTMQALTEAPLLARTDGYLKRRLVDIGDRVRAGQVLAEIDAPE